jgi:hypothetical protein
LGFAFIVVQLGDYILRPIEMFATAMLLVNRKNVAAGGFVVARDCSGHFSIRFVRLNLAHL